MERRVGRGFSLVELLLSASLGFMLLGLLTYALVPLLHYAAWGSSRAALVETAALASQRLMGDLQTSNLHGLSLPTAASPGLLAIHALVDTTDTGLAVWDNHLVVYRWDAAQGSLTRREWDSATVTSAAPATLSPAQMGAIFSTPGPERCLAQGVIRDFSLTTAPDHGLPLNLYMVLEARVAGRDSAERYSLRRDIYLRNGTSP